jgi:hypothetical protein
VADVFISYKSERRAAAEHLAEVLTDHGYSVWWDYGLISGRDFGRQIESELRAAKAVVVLWCSLAVESDWVREEATLAKTLNKIIPTKIEQVDLPLGFSLAQTLDLSAWDGAPQSPKLDRLVRDIGHLVGRPPAPNYDGLDRTERAWRRFGAPPLREFALIDALEPKTTRTLPSTLTAPRPAQAPPVPPPKVERVPPLPSSPASTSSIDAAKAYEDATPAPTPASVLPAAAPDVLRQVLYPTPIVWALTIVAVFFAVLMTSDTTPEHQLREMFANMDALGSHLVIMLASAVVLGLRYALSRGVKSWPPIAHTLAAISPVLALLLILLVAHPPSSSDGGAFAGMSLTLVAFALCVHFVPRALATKASSPGVASANAA